MEEVLAIAAGARVVPEVVLDPHVAFGHKDADWCVEWKDANRFHHSEVLAAGSEKEAKAEAAALLGVPVAAIRVDYEEYDGQWGKP